MNDINNSRFKDAVCIDAMRVFDSCSAQDCLENVEFTFSQEDQETVNNATYIRTQNIDVTDVDFNISPVAFNQGFYSVDVTFYFRAQIEVYTEDGAPPEVIYGTANFTKRVILYGSDGGTRRFVSDSCCDPATESPVTGCGCCCRLSTLPTASVNIVPPMCLDTTLSDGDPRTVLITIGIFAIISLSRHVPLMVPVFDYCQPGKECTSNSSTPCEMFEKIDFPTNEFFPRGLEDNCGCNNRNNENNDNGDNDKND